MKKFLLSSAFVCIATISANAQQLLSDNFDSYTVGNVGTDITGATPGQGSWFTAVGTGGANANFQFVAETGKGNVLTIESPAVPATTTGTSNSRLASKVGFTNAMWNTKTAGNNILKVEYEFYTGGTTTSKSIHQVSVSSTAAALGGFRYEPLTKTLSGLSRYDNSGTIGYYYFELGSNDTPLVLDANTWVKVVVLIDFSTNKVHWQVPSKSIDLNIAAPLTGQQPSQISFVATGGPTGNASATTIKYDNYVVSAVNTTTATVNDIVSTKFNVYPNPATDVITITNTESIGIDKITVADINGRIAKTNNYNQQAEIQLNVSDLNAGVYILNVSTKEGTATKKFIKK